MITIDSTNMHTASVLPYSWAQETVARGSARVLSLSEIDWALPVHALWRAHSATLPARRFVEALRASAADFVPSPETSDERGQLLNPEART